MAHPILIRYFRKKDLSNTLVAEPDVGSAKFAGHFAKQIGTPMAVIDKRRTDDSESPQSIALIGDVKDKDVIVYDDEIATGGSIREAARILRDFGAKEVRVGVTHGVFSGNAFETLNDANLDELVVTDTLPIPGLTQSFINGLKVLTTANMFGDAIKRIHHGQSLSELMEA
jgi:ribose-phosphate pyrophosphokinase